MEGKKGERKEGRKDVMEGYEGRSIYVDVCICKTEHVTVGLLSLLIV